MVDTSIFRDQMTIRRLRVVASHRARDRLDAWPAPLPAFGRRQPEQIYQTTVPGTLVKQIIDRPKS